MSCPVCGSDESRPIAPNWVECTAEIRERVLVGRTPIFGPGRSGVLIGTEPVFDTRVSVCGVRHHRVVNPGGNDNWAICRCGTFAIGICRGCGVPVCGDDSTRVVDSRFCSVCAVDATAKAQAAAGEQRRVEAERQREQDERVAAARRQEAETAHRAAQEEAIRRHGPCRAFPKHPREFTDAAGNCRACVVGLR